MNISHVTITQDNDICLEQFAANIPQEFNQRYHLVVDDRTLVPGRQTYDLVIIDDAVSPQGYAYLDQGMTCFVEGGRSLNRQEIQSELAGRGLHCELINYNRGTRYSNIVLRRSKKAGIPYPKFRLRKVLNGCWIDAVEPTGVQLKPLAG